MQLEKINEYLDRSAQDEGAEMWCTNCDLPDERLLLPADAVPQLLAVAPHRAGRNLRPGRSPCRRSAPSRKRSRRRTTRRTDCRGGVWTDKGSKIFKVTTKLRAGVIWANTYNKFDPTSPFGGYKESGMGREGGLHGLLPYLNLN